MSQQYLAYQLNKTINPNAEDIVKWHSKGTKCTPMSVSDFLHLLLLCMPTQNHTMKRCKQLKNQSCLHQQKMRFCLLKSSIKYYDLVNKYGASLCIYEAPH